MNARNFVDYTSERIHCESRMREICTYGLTRRRARPVRPSLLYWLSRPRLSVLPKFTLFSKLS
jgi:hypothetical protein